MAVTSLKKGLSFYKEKGIPKSAFASNVKDLTVKVSPISLGAKFLPYLIQFENGFFVPKDANEFFVLSQRAKLRKDVVELPLEALEKAVALLKASKTDAKEKK